MKGSWASLASETFKELSEAEFGHVVAVLITSVGFLLFVVAAIPFDSY